MAQNTGNTTSFVEQEVYSRFILTNLHDGMLPKQFYRNVTDFVSGDTLNIPTVGSRTIQNIGENEALDLTAIETDRIQFRITEQTGDGMYITDDLREDGFAIEALLAQSALESTIAIQEDVETKYFKQCNDSQVDADPNTINGFKHRITASGVNNTLTLTDLADMKLSFDKANVPYGSRVAMVDPVVASTLDRLVSIARDVTPFAEKILEQGFDRDHAFLMDIYGWSIITSNRLDTGAFSDGSNVVTKGKANVFMSVMSDNHKPLMFAWRRMPVTESERNVKLRRDEITTTTRYGFGTQRVDTLGIIITSATATS
jgi:hypothetical protein